MANLGKGYNMNKIAKLLYIIIGSITLVLGLLGIFLPILPTTPLLLITLVMYTKGSERLKRWFVSTKIYKYHLKTFVITKKMTMKFKIRTLILVSVLFLIPIIFMETLWIRIMLFVLLLAHYLMILMKIKTLTGSDFEKLIRKQDEYDERKTKMD
jgi:uncharacterized protein